MGFHPRDLPVSKTYDIKDEGEVQGVIEEMVMAGFAGTKGYRVLMPKEEKKAKRIGYMVTTGVTRGLGQKNEPRDIKYWTYHHDETRYGIVLIRAGAVPES